MKEFGNVLEGFDEFVDSVALCEEDYQFVYCVVHVVLVMVLLFGGLSCGCGVDGIMELFEIVFCECL